ncbi:homeodomain-interacting protein kinase 1-like [Salarias fasciatus]|uniref:homeodomain-interacting protein kinase 1-like n=1 Tax=Salarias fasciatus TaxID=181472 RepID=UPI001176AE5C|nr:homeodomain-interacting protein kinase 1-like [Salarias fasciatus]
MGEGSYGKVVKGQKLDDKRNVAIKVLKRDGEDVWRELNALRTIAVLDADLCNVVQFYECFNSMGRPCMAFEMLDLDLYQFMGTRKWAPMPCSEIRPIAKQLLVALDALASLGVVHSDVKTDNVMLVDAVNQPLRVKLIDFGLARSAVTILQGELLQAVAYRAPEIWLGLPITEAIDMWGLGCTLAFLLLGINLFPSHCEYQTVRFMVQILGQPEDRLIQAGMFSQAFFVRQFAPGRPRFRLRTPEEYFAGTGYQTTACSPFTTLSCLDQLVHIHPHHHDSELEDRKALVDLLKGMLDLDGRLRLRPHEALQHPFISMSHLRQDPRHTQYLIASQQNLEVSAVKDSIQGQMPFVAPKDSLSPDWPVAPKESLSPDWPVAPKESLSPDWPASSPKPSTEPSVYPEESPSPEEASSPEPSVARTDEDVERLVRLRCCSSFFSGKRFASAAGWE